MLSKRMSELVETLPANFEAAIISGEANRFYLLDFDSHDAGTLLLLPDEAVFIIDSRYVERASTQVKSARVCLDTNATEQISQILHNKSISRVYLESEISVRRLNSLMQLIPFVEYATDDTLSNSMIALRAQKDEEELARMRKAQEITDACFTHILSYIKPGVREADLALEIDYFMRKNGADKPAFDTICVAGQNSSLPHGIPGDYRLTAGDFITLDFGAKYNGYCSDMTRTVALGNVNAEQRKVYDTVLKAHLVGIQTAKAGLLGCEVDKAARNIINEAGYAGCFGHGLGHSLGIEVHETPRFSPKDKTHIKAGMVLSVEPGIYLEDRFGCRIEDTVLIHENGCEPLPKSSKELISL